MVCVSVPGRLLTPFPLLLDQVVNAILEMCRQISHHTDTILDLSHIDRTMALQIVPFDVRQLLDDVISIARHTAELKGLEINLHTKNLDREYMVGDAHRLKQVLLNLLDVVIHSTSAGTVTLYVDCSIAESTLGACTVNVHLRVKGAGEGMSLEQLEDLLQRLSQPSDQVTIGNEEAGLWVCCRILEAMNGTLGVVVDEPEPGNAFYVELNLPVWMESAHSAYLKTSETGVTAVTTKSSDMDDMHPSRELQQVVRNCNEAVLQTWVLNDSFISQSMSYHFGITDTIKDFSAGLDLPPNDLFSTDTFSNELPTDLTQRHVVHKEGGKMHTTFVVNNCIDIDVETECSSQGPSKQPSVIIEDIQGDRKRSLHLNPGEPLQQACDPKDSPMLGGGFGNSTSTTQYQTQVDQISTEDVACSSNSVPRPRRSNTTDDVTASSLLAKLATVSPLRHLQASTKQRARVGISEDFPIDGGRSGVPQTIKLSPEAYRRSRDPGKQVVACQTTFVDNGCIDLEETEESTPAAFSERNHSTAFSERNHSVILSEYSADMSNIDSRGKSSVTRPSCATSHQLETQGSWDFDSIMHQVRGESTINLRPRESTETSSVSTHKRHTGRALRHNNTGQRTPWGAGRQRSVRKRGLGMRSALSPSMTHDGVFLLSPRTSERVPEPRPSRGERAGCMSFGHPPQAIPASASSLPTLEQIDRLR